MALGSPGAIAISCDRVPHSIAHHRTVLTTRVTAHVAPNSYVLHPILRPQY